jgi:hypothetical protein
MGDNRAYRDLDLMGDVIPGFESDEGREVLIDLARVAAGASGSYRTSCLPA